MAAEKLLLENSFDIQEPGFDKAKALCWAASNCQLSVVPLLLKDEAGIKAKDRNGFTPLHLAATDGNGAAVLLLLERGAQIDAKSKDESTALHLAVKSRHEVVVRQLVEHKASIKMPNNVTGSAALHIAADKEFVTILQIFLDASAVVNAKRLGDKYRHTPCRQEWEREDSW
ncbi:hypothetical protein B0J14DRAFT_689797 [Halenospora varia]|nr:hypothetical protein B0J14DRAFT_689797 [Halenospora varia]